MRVTNISVGVRYSRHMADGSFKTVEIGAEATLDPHDDYHDAQVALYHELGKTMKCVFSLNGRDAQNGSRMAVQPPAAAPLPPAPPQEHYCQQHQTRFKKFTKDGKTWYSHKAPDGK